MWWIVAVGILIFAWVMLWRPLRALSRDIQFNKAKKFFHTQRERLEAKFICLAAQRAKPESPRLSDCTFSDDVSYVRDRASGELSAFVAVSMAMEESKAADYNNGDAVGNLQIGTAVFRFDRDHWETDGRAILNLGPAEAIRFFQKDIEKVGEELGHPYC